MRVVERPLGGSVAGSGAAVVTGGAVTAVGAALGRTVWLVPPQARIDTSPNKQISRSANSHAPPVHANAKRRTAPSPHLTIRTTGLP